MASHFTRIFHRCSRKTLTNLQLLRQSVRQLSNLNPSDLVVITKQKKLYLIGINRPDKRNCIDDETAAQLRTAFETFENDDEAYAAVLYGKGGNFCSGYDLKEVAKGNFYGIASEHGPMGPTKKLLKKPVVASVNGYAVAGGFELALWCDLRVVEETAVMGFFNRRFGVPLVNGSTVRLPQLIGLSRALDLILTGRPLSAKEAFEMGIATKITACGTGLGNAINLANSLCKFPQECLRADRFSAYHSSYNSQSLEESLRFEYQNASHVLTKESKSGAESFMKGIGRHGKFHLNNPEEKEES
ncbi:probable enoyl-CoA hydratase, mitochondrial [Trichonephila clavata]|uniref:Probable enoyl-CoA hydratase, mitochondrial n=1 Tax=Trichonephila clavata TaxID=2740835 RepID=A0A8X6KWM7_TRICU|nr:probable enoyl-CoA hydratase, mitochondrial [Trichonephila clavata]